MIGERNDLREKLSNYFKHAIPLLYVGVESPQPRRSAQVRSARLGSARRGAARHQRAAASRELRDHVFVHHVACIQQLINSTRLMIHAQSLSVGFRIEETSD